MVECCIKMKAVIIINPKMKELHDFIWTETGDPPPLNEPKIKKKKKDKEENVDKNNPS